MVLQNRYKRAASARYNKTGSSAPSADRSAALLDIVTVGRDDEDGQGATEERPTFARRSMKQDSRYDEAEETEEPTEESERVFKRAGDGAEAFALQASRTLDRKQSSFRLFFSSKLLDQVPR